MLRRHYNKIVSTIFLILCTFTTGLILIQSNSISVRQPASTSDFTQNDFDHATPAVSLSEFQNSKPTAGRSYFDMIFSKKTNNGTQYDIPFPFNKVIAKLEDYNGQKINLSESLGPKIVIFPMGRSLQRNAAFKNLTQTFSFDPYFRYPRVVMAIDEEPKYENSLLLNLKNKFYVGFNEHAELLEVISYNDESGRFEYQLVQDYALGKSPHVSYANRSLCLSCHQNQTPIFSNGPWSESNANPQMADELKKKMDSTFGKVACTDKGDQSYCYKNANESFYFGAPLRIDQSSSSQFDVATDEANLYHAYQKNWKELCADNACRLSLLEAILLYRFSSFEGLIPDSEIKSALTQIEQNWKTKYPNGLSIANPNIPNRDPLKDIASNSAISASTLATVKPLDQQTVEELLSHSKIPAEFEPLLPRRPLDIWKDSGFDSHQTNRLLKGLANEFTQADIKMFDQWLLKDKNANQLVSEVTSQCQIDHVGKDLSFMCSGAGSESFSFEAYFPAKNQGLGHVSSFSIASNKLNCDPNASQIDENRYSGKSCPQFTDLVVNYSPINSTTAKLSFKRSGGLSLRTLQGFSIAEVIFNLATKQARLKIYNQSAAIKNILAANQAELFKTQTFSRFQIMKTLMNYAHVHAARLQNSDMAGLEMKAEGDILVSELKKAMTGLDVMKNTCIKCHQNNENAPPNFMGSPLVKTSNVDQCRRIEQCAPRLIYRLKMRNCAESDFNKKKNPMPPDSFFENLPLTKDIWMKSYASKVLVYLNSLVTEADVAKSFVAHGMAQAEATLAAQDILRNDCPAANSVMYDQLPKCDFKQLKDLTKCI